MSLAIIQIFYKINIIYLYKTHFKNNLFSNFYLMIYIKNLMTTKNLWVEFIYYLITILML